MTLNIFSNITRYYLFVNEHCPYAVAIRRNDLLRVLWQTIRRSVGHQSVFRPKGHNYGNQRIVKCESSASNVPARAIGWSIMVGHRYWPDLTQVDIWRCRSPKIVLITHKDTHTFLWMNTERVVSRY